ncbi:MULTISPECIES: L-tyrosine/L-tryptophan isonitrile synthase family protein [unclassified Actinopolyspora]|uniref:L-tyrosine/L-tryptophan isonitrile synthase family protein n=1 Tax=unclassified Actinopolyspora TaxID=2639451 RepID=UPI001F61B1EF|nr:MULTISPECIES: L-tyrosine/L-tryptophan isonitrile synthase family protein [unclassified Actinopolyspora]
MNGRPRLGPEKSTATVRPFGTWPLEAEEANSILAGGDYGLRVVWRDHLAWLVGERAGSGIPLGPAPTWTRLYRVLIRLRSTRKRRDPDWLALLTGALDPYAPLERQRRSDDDWWNLVEMVDGDPMLRMHCATSGARPGSDAERTAMPNEPLPAHPEFPGGTIPVTVPALLGPCSALPRTLLGEVVANRFERDESALHYFLEYFIRPPLRAFRLVLENSGALLLTPRVGALAVELSPELQATGRVVITSAAGVCDASRVTSADVREGVRALARTLDTLAGGFESFEFGERGARSRRTRSAVQHVIAAELRDLEADSADVLSGQHPLRGFVHTVPAEQDALLRRVLHTVQERTRKRRWDRRVPQPMVVIDLDSCGLVTSGGKRTERFGDPEVRDPFAPLCRGGHLSAEPEDRPGRAGGGIPSRVRPGEFKGCAVDGGAAQWRTGAPLWAGSVHSGLPRFVWDVRDAGGRVVFCFSGDRDGEYVRKALDETGVPEADLIHVPEESTESVAEWTVRRLRELGQAEVVAVFDDKMARDLGRPVDAHGTFVVALSAGEVMPRQRDGGSVNGTAEQRTGAAAASVIDSFETSPRKRLGRRSPVLSNTHSLEELHVAALRENRSAQRWAVRLSGSETESIVANVIDDADRAAERTACGALAKFPGSGQAGNRWDDRERVGAVVGALHHVFTRKQFLKGSRSNYVVADMQRDVGDCVARGEPVEVVLLGFPVKQSLNRLKAYGPLPDIAEFGGLVRLRELQQAVRRVYPPGLRINVLTDGRHFRPRPSSMIRAYTRKLHEYASMAGVDGYVSIRELDTVAAERLGPRVVSRRPEMFHDFRGCLERVVADFDITDNPLRTLDQVQERAEKWDGAEGVTARSLQLFREMVMSMVYSVPVPVPSGVDRLDWARTVYADVYNLTDTHISPEVRQARVAVLRRAWHNAIRYLSTMRVDEELGYEELFSPRVRLTVSAVTKGRCGFTYLGGSGLLPWQGTGVLDARGYIAVDFAVSLLDQGFVPAYSALLGRRQPLMMVPAQYTELPLRGTRSEGTRLDGELRSRARLRRK